MYYLMLEEAITHYNEYQLLLKDAKIREINKVKLLKLLKQPALDNFMIVKSNLFNEYPYATIKGGDKNIRSVMKDLEFKQEDILLHLKVPSQSNFNRKVKEILGEKYERQKLEIKRKLERERL